ncbi:MAG: M3 family oligoendopeptidase [Chloroflexi bacterium]|nr:M3 family oligoendopeptidase [Chloroflexota bacterium]
MVVTTPVAEPGAPRELPSWDLSELYAGIDDPRLDADLDAVLALARAFETDYKGRLASLDDAALAEAFQRYETILTRATPPATYAHLVHAADAANPRHGALVAKVLERGTQIQNHLLFFELELAQLDAERLRAAVASEGLRRVRHYIEKVLQRKPYQLSEPEERVLNEKEVTSGAAFARLFDELTSTMQFTLEVEGRTERLNQSALLAYLYHPDRGLRQRAAESLTTGLRQYERQLVFIYNTLLQDKAIEDRLRGYPEPETARHLSNELTSEIVEAMVAAAVEGYPLVARWYHLKRRLLGLDKLYVWDRYAPLPGSPQDIPWDDARRLVVEAYAAFAPEIGEIVERFFARRWIDAALRDGKRGGAFCAANTPDTHPYVLLNYTGKPRDVMTLGHELGHGIHDVLSSVQSILVYHPPLALAETASVFGEILVFDALLRQLTDRQQRLAFLASKIEDLFATTFRQVAMYRFEQRAHRARRQQGELDSATLGTIWQDELQAMFGDSLELTDGHRLWWSYIPHFIHSPFYVYAYPFGQFLTLGLYRLYQQEGPAFVAKYRQLFSAGGSVGPRELLASIGIDIADPGFWRAGMGYIEELLAEAERLSESPR